MVPVGPVVARCQTAQPRRVLWAYLSDPELRAAWWPELHLEARLGGIVREQWSEGDASRDASGEVDVIVDGHALGFRWTEAGDPRATAVLVTLRSIGAGASLTVTETGFDMLPDPSARAAASQEGWDVLLRDLSAAVDDLDETDAAAAVAAAAASNAAPIVTDSTESSSAGEGAEPEHTESANAEPEASEFEEAVSDDDAADIEVVEDAEVVDEVVIEGAEDAVEAPSHDLERVEPDEPVELPDGDVDSESAAWAASGVSITVNGAAPGDGEDDEIDASTDFDRLLRGR